MARAQSAQRLILDSVHAEVLDDPEVEMSTTFDFEHDEHVPEV